MGKPPVAGLRADAETPARLTSVGAFLKESFDVENMRLTVYRDFLRMQANPA
jgi:hypothetical protein